LALSIVATGCGGEAGLSAPPPGGGNDLRPGLTVDVAVDPTIASVAQTLGWSDGVPGAELRVHRFGTDFSWDTAVSDGSGVARLPQLVSGRYRVAVYRPLTAEQSQTTGLSALGAGGILDVSAGGTTASLRLKPSREGSLVISEVYATAPFVAETTYDFHMFFEVYNNSDQVVFLDGVIFGSMLGIPDINTSTWPCSITEPFRKDPDGVWAVFLNRFPGSGADYPLGPGAAAVVALDAIDHSTIDPRFPDLSGADFELLGSGDVDNPDVPNLVEVGTRSFQLGHGLRFFVGETLFLSAPLDPDDLSRGIIPNASSDYLRVPASSLLDVVWTEDDDALEEQLYDSCGGVVHGSFDELGGGFVEHGVDLTLSVQRIPLPGSPGKLQDTNVSAVDLVKGPITPGRVP
jgi:hypothetical protein